MSGVYIKGLKMPKSCRACQLERRQDTQYDFEFRCCPVTGTQTNRYLKDRPQNCPLLPVPNHGRLIDADEADRRYTPDFTELSDFQCGWNAAMKRVCEDAPTIIPADKEDGE